MRACHIYLWYAFRRTRLRAFLFPPIKFPVHSPPRVRRGSCSPEFFSTGRVSRPKAALFIVRIMSGRGNRRPIKSALNSRRLRGNYRTAHKRARNLPLPRSFCRKRRQIEPVLHIKPCNCTTSADALQQVFYSAQNILIPIFVEFMPIIMCNMHNCCNAREYVVEYYKAHNNI